MTREIAFKVFSKVASDGANTSNELTDADRYAVVLRPETKDFAYGYPSLENPGFAITPKVHLTMRMSILNAAGMPVMEKDYDSGVVSGSRYMVSVRPTERINYLAHEAMYGLMRRAADDVHIYQQTLAATSATVAPAWLAKPLSANGTTVPQTTNLIPALPESTARCAALGVDLAKLAVTALGGMDGLTGAMVTAVAPHTAAAEAGIRLGDILLRVGDTGVNDPSDVQRATAAIAHGAIVPVKLTRQARPFWVNVQF